MSVRIENLIRKYLMNVDLADQANDDGKEKLEVKCVDNQFNLMGKLQDDYTKKAVRETCKESTIERVQTFYKMYFA